MDEVVKKLIELRKESGVTLEELAKRMGTVHARLSEIEHGKIGLTCKRLYQWADALGYDVSVTFNKK